MSTNDNKDKAIGSKSVTSGLAAMLAKKAEEPNAVHTPSAAPAIPTLTNSVNRTEPPLEIEKPLPDDPPAPEHAFRVFNHRYEFKIKDRVLKADAMNIYTPMNREEFEFLRFQVERGLIHFY